MIVVKNREMLIPNAEYNIGTNTDSSSENRIFQIERVSSSGVDLANLTYRIDLQYSADRPITGSNKDTVVPTVEITDNYILLTWNITQSQLEVPGSVLAQISAFDESNMVRWSSFIGAFFVEDAINTPGTYTGDLSAVNQFIAEIETVKTISADEATRKANETIRVSNEKVRNIAENLRETHENTREEWFGQAKSTYNDAIAAKNEAIAAKNDAIAAKNQLEEAIAQHPGSTVVDPTFSIAGAAAEAIAVGKLKDDLIKETTERNNAISNEQSARTEAIFNAVNSEKERAVARENEIESLFTAPTEEAVTKWLNEHPEATTTVQDGSLEEIKFTEELKNKAIKDYVTPQMFGAKGDGTTDDTNAFVSLFQYAQRNNKTIYIPNGTYCVASKLTLFTYAKIIGENRHKTTLKAISPMDVILDGSNCTIVTISDIRFDGNNLANKCLALGNTERITAHSELRNLILKNAIDCNLWLYYFELSHVERIMSIGSKIGIYLETIMTVKFADIQASDASEKCVYIVNSDGFDFKNLYVFNDSVLGQTLCEITNVSNALFDYAHFEPQADVACNLKIASDTNLLRSETNRDNAVTNIIFNRPNFIGYHYTGDLIKLSIDGNESGAVRSLISNIRFNDGEFITPKDGSFIVNNEGCRDVCFKNCVQKDYYKPDLLSRIKDYLINNPMNYTIKQIFDWGCGNTLINTTKGTQINTTSLYIKTSQSLPAGTYYLCTDKIISNTDINIGKTFAEMQTLFTSDANYKDSFAKIVFETEIPSGYYIKLERGLASTYYKDASFVLWTTPTSVNGNEVYYQLSTT